MNIIQLHTSCWALPCGALRARHALWYNPVLCPVNVGASVVPKVVQPSICRLASFPPHSPTNTFHVHYPVMDTFSLHLPNLPYMEWKPMTTWNLNCWASTSMTSAVNRCSVSRFKTLKLLYTPLIELNWWSNRIMATRNTRASIDSVYTEHRCLMDKLDTLEG